MAYSSSVFVQIVETRSVKYIFLIYTANYNVGVSDING